jgi:hypothetical protein
MGYHLHQKLGGHIAVARTRAGHRRAREDRVVACLGRPVARTPQEVAVSTPPATPPAPALADIERFLCEAVAALTPEEAGRAGRGGPVSCPR